jgi:starch-binding outer membrane protein, SusD/RagB family
MKRIKILTLLFILVFGTRCGKDFLEKPPLNEITAASFWLTESDAVLGLTAVYDALQMQSGYRLGTIMFGDIAGDDMTCFDINWYVKTDAFTFNADDAEMKNSWRAWYSGISRANSVIKRVPDIAMDESLKARLVNEAKFLRALDYFNLVTIWGEVPLVTTEMDNTELLALKRESQENIWAQIETDLKDAEALPSEYPASDLGRATSGAAKALLARSYLYQKKYDLAASKAKEVIDGGVYDLHDEYTKNFQTAYENKGESIFEVQFTTGTGGWGNNEGNFAPSFSGPGGGGFVPTGSWGIIIPEASVKTTYEPGDARRAVNIFEEGSVYNNLQYDPTWSPSGVSFAKLIAGDPPSSSENIIDGERNMPVIRYAEVLLIYAEALNEQGLTDEALPYLNRIRERADLDPLDNLNQVQFRDALLQERRIEFFGEGHRFFDLRRMGKSMEFIHDKAGKNNYSEPKNLYFPIPQVERDLNSNLTQNTGY